MVTLAPKTFDLLVFMAESGGRLISKRELMDTLWNGTFVEESNISFQMSSLRRALGPEANTWIEAVPKYGYRYQRAGGASGAAPDGRETSWTRSRGDAEQTRGELLSEAAPRVSASLRLRVGGI